MAGYRSSFGAGQRIDIDEKLRADLARTRQRLAAIQAIVRDIRRAAQTADSPDSYRLLVEQLADEALRT